MEQRIGYAKSSGGLKIAYAQSGNGPPLVRVGTWLTHLHHDWDSDIWRHWFEFFSRDHTLVRYDPRGCGLSAQPNPKISFEGFVDDLEAVVDALGLDSFPLFGMSQGVAVAIEYAARHPEKVSQLVLYSGGCVGWDIAKGTDTFDKWNAIEQMICNGWGDDNPAVRSLFVNYFVPGATPEQQQAYTESARKSASREVAGEIMRVIGSLNVLDKLSAMTMPTQIIQISEDGLVPASAAQVLAEGIPNPEFVLVDSKNHILRAEEPGWKQFTEAISRFLDGGEDSKAAQKSELLEELTDRESEILRRIALGHKNARIAEELFISEKTVRNHITNVFSKLGVNSRSEAIVLAKDSGL